MPFTAAPADVLNPTLEENGLFWVKVQNLKSTVQREPNAACMPHNSILSYFPFEGFVYDELDIDPNNYYSEHTPLGFFDKEFPFLAVIQKDEIWMSVIPHEINTMKKPIQNAFGNVLVLGLGIGYYQFMIALKEEVKSITIIESDKNAIKIFNECIYPFVKNKDKIHIINDDAFEFLKNNDLNKFDYIFSDIWHNAGDGLPLYLKIN